MTYFRIKLQIPSILLPPNKQSKKMLGYGLGIGNFDSSIDPRYFWSWCRCKKKINDTKVDNLPTKCGKQLPERPKLCNPECGSKCLQIRGCDKEIVKQKLSNCKKAEKPETETYWEMIFGWKLEEPPDPCTCRRIYGEKQIARKQDPRLCDSRYEATPGDVFVFTEVPRTINCKSQEIRPKPPPPFKLPSAVMTKNIIQQAEKTAIPCAAALQFSDNCISQKCSGPKPYNLPYDELRPSRSQRKAFSCKLGMRPEDVAPPTRKGSANCLVSRSAASFDPQQYREKSAQSVIDWKPINAKTHQLLPQGNHRHSRIEQLKRQTNAKQGNDYSDILGSGLKNDSESQSSWCPSSCKNATIPPRRNFSTCNLQLFRDVIENAA